MRYVLQDNHITKRYKSKRVETASHHRRFLYDIYVDKQLQIDIPKPERIICYPEHVQ